jgi:NAD(P)-dependent dehydrogenase (short-subunit alcohol dehydrogenase family)
LSLFDLTGKNAYVTGASRGIGRTVAVALAEAGAGVALVARGADGLAETAEAIHALGRKTCVIPTDVTSYDAVADSAAAAIDQLGHIDIVVNNAGGSNFMVPFRDLRLSGWDKPGARARSACLHTEHQERKSPLSRYSVAATCRA